MGEPAREDFQLREANLAAAERLYINLRPIGIAAARLATQLDILFTRRKGLDKKKNHVGFDKKLHGDSGLIHDIGTLTILWRSLKAIDQKLRDQDFAPYTRKSGGFERGDFEEDCVHARKHLADAMRFSLEDPASYKPSKRTFAIREADALVSHGMISKESEFRAKHPEVRSYIELGRSDFRDLNPNLVALANQLLLLLKWLNHLEEEKRPALNEDAKRRMLKYNERKLADDYTLLDDCQRISRILITLHSIGLKIVAKEFAIYSRIMGGLHFPHDFAEDVEAMRKLTDKAHNAAPATDKVAKARYDPQKRTTYLREVANQANNLVKKEQRYHRELAAEGDRQERALRRDRRG